jgi:RecA-family ATPase
MSLADALAAGMVQKPPAPKRTMPETYTMRDLAGMTFPEPRWAVPDLIPEGLTVLAGAPKVGKSWLALHLCLAVSSGGYALGSIPVARGDTLYLALEDSAPRLQRRVAQLLNGEEPPESASVRHQASPVGPDLIEELDVWRESVERPRLIVLDVLARVRPAGDSRNAYQADYSLIAPMQEYARDHAVAFVVVHHTNKAQWADGQDAISGTRGLSGAADTTLVLRRERNLGEATLDVTGRDVEEAQHTLAFDGQTGTWKMVGPGTMAGASDQRRRILEVLQNEGPMKPLSVAQRLDISHDSARQMLRRMGRSEQVEVRPGGLYAPCHSGHSVTIGVGHE